MDEKAFRRILVALDASGSSEAALEAAAGLARDLQAELQGVFVEDIDLLSLAALPFAREIGTTFSTFRQLNPEAMQRSLRAQARRARHSIETICARYRVSWGFEVMHGRVLQGVLASSASVDMVAIGGRGRVLPGERRRLGSTVAGLVAHGASSVLIIQEGRRLGAPVVLLVTDPDISAAALATAMRLARLYDKSLTVVAMGDRAAEAQSAAERVLGAAADLDVRYRRVERDDSAAVAAILKQEGCGLLVLDAGKILTGPGATFEKLVELNVPILLAR